MIIRKFRKKDARRVSHLIKKTHREVSSKNYNKRVIDSFVRLNTPSKIINKSKNVDYFLALKGKILVGFNGISGNEVRTFFVNPRYQRKGIGKKLMQNIDKIAKKRKIKRLIVKSSVGAEDFYKKCGFKKIRKVKEKYGNVSFYIILMYKKL